MKSHSSDFLLRGFFHQFPNVLLFLKKTFLFTSPPLTFQKSLTVFLFLRTGEDSLAGDVVLRGGGTAGAGMGGGIPHGGGGGGIPPARLAGPRTLCSSSLSRSVKSKSQRARERVQPFTSSSQCSSVSDFLISGGLMTGGISEVGLLSTSAFD